MYWKQPVTSVMRDFTTKKYRELLIALLKQGYTFQSFHDYLVQPAAKSVIIRHDVDTRKKNSLHFAYIEQAFDVKTTYYFRILPKSFDPVIVDLISNLGHEIGYHYEDLTLAKGDMERAIAMFQKHLDELRKHYPITTICMHGSPLSRYDNRDIWQHYDYRQFGIIGEPYFDIDYSQLLYLTDTGRTWNNQTISVRDKVKSPFEFTFTTTQDIIDHLPQLPNHLMLNFHPQRWDDDYLPWLRELVLQNLKNSVKKHFFVRKNL